MFFLRNRGKRDKKKRRRKPKNSYKYKKKLKKIVSDFQCVFYVCKRLVKHTQLFVHNITVKLKCADTYKYFEFLLSFGRVILVSRLFFVSTIYIFEKGGGAGRYSFTIYSLPWCLTVSCFQSSIQSWELWHGKFNGHTVTREPGLRIIHVYLELDRFTTDTYRLRYALTETHHGMKRIFVFTTSNEMFIDELYFSLWVVIFMLLTFCFSMIKYSQCSPLFVSQVLSQNVQNQ